MLIKLSDKDKSPKTTQKVREALKDPVLFEKETDDVKYVYKGGQRRKYISTKKIEEDYGIARSVIYRMRESDSVASEKLGGRWFISESDIAKLQEAESSSTTKDAASVMSFLYPLSYVSSALASLGKLALIAPPIAGYYAGKKGYEPIASPDEMDFEGLRSSDKALLMHRISEDLEMDSMRRLRSLGLELDDMDRLR